MFKNLAVCLPGHAAAKMWTPGAAAEAESVDDDRAAADAAALNGARQTVGKARTNSRTTVKDEMTKI